MRYPAYPEYKESGVQWLGQVPEHWEVKRGRFTMRVNPPAPILHSLGEDQEVSFVPMDAVNEYGGIRLDQTRVKAEAGGGYTEFQDSDIIIAKITPCFENGKGSIATRLVNSAAYGTTELHVLRASQVLDYRFLFYLTITNGYRKLGESEMYGAGGQKRVPPEFCKDFLTPLPPLPEQTAIADFLDRETGRIDTLVAKKRRLIALLKEKRTVLISRTVTRGLPASVARAFGLEPHTRFKDSGIEWLGQVPEGWEVTALKWRIRTKSGDGIPTFEVSPEKSVDANIPVIGGNGIMGYCSSANSNTPVLAVGRVGALCGNVHEINYSAWITDNSLVLTVQRNTFDLKYLASVLRTRNLNEIADKTAQPLITGTRVRAEFAPVPPLPEQTAISTYLDRETAKIDRLVEKIELLISRLQEYRAALITAAVTGKIDVRSCTSQEVST